MQNVSVSLLVSLIAIGGIVAALAYWDSRAAFRTPGGPIPKYSAALRAGKIEPLPPIRRPVRIVAFGTSLTALSTWPDLLAEELNDCRPEGVTVARVARAGATSTWGVAALPEVLGEEPDLVLMEFALNDASLRHGTSYRQSVKLHRRMIAKLRDAVPRVVLMTMNDVYGGPAWNRPGLGRYYEMARRLGLSEADGAIDLFPLWQQRAKHRAEDLPDGLHPTNAAMQRHALPRIVEALTPIVCTAQLPASITD